MHAIVVWDWINFFSKRAINYKAVSSVSLVSFHPMNNNEQQINNSPDISIDSWITGKKKRVILPADYSITVFSSW